MFKILELNSKTQVQFQKSKFNRLEFQNPIQLRLDFQNRNTVAVEFSWSKPKHSRICNNHLVVFCFQPFSRYSVPKQEKARRLWVGLVRIHHKYNPGPIIVINPLARHTWFSKLDQIHLQTKLFFIFIILQTVKFVVLRSHHSWKKKQKSQRFQDQDSIFLFSS